MKIQSKLKEPIKYYFADFFHKWGGGGGTKSARKISLVHSKPYPTQKDHF